MGSLLLSHLSVNLYFIVVSIEIELPTALENAQLPAFSSLLQLISKRNDYITLFCIIRYNCRPMFFFDFTEYKLTKEITALALQRRTVIFLPYYGLAYVLLIRLL